MSLIGSIVYVVYPTAAYQSRVISDFFLGAAFKSGRSKRELCQVEHLKHFNFSEGWVSSWGYTKIIDGKEVKHWHPKIVSADKKNIYLDPNTALSAVEKEYQHHLKTHQDACIFARAYLDKAKENLNYCRKKLREAKELDVKEHFLESIAEIVNVDADEVNNGR